MIQRRRKKGAKILLNLADSRHADQRGRHIRMRETKAQREFRQLDTMSLANIICQTARVANLSWSRMPFRGGIGLVLPLLRSNW